MKKVVKKTVVKKPVLKKAQLGAEVSPIVSDESKYYKSRRGIRPDKEISEKKYLNKRYRMTKSADVRKYDYDSVNNPESSYRLYDASGEKTVTVPANKTMTYTKTKGIGKGKSIKEVRPIEKEKKGGVVKKVTAKKTIVKSKKK